MMGAVERSIERLPHSAKFARQAELERDKFLLGSLLQLCRWCDDHRAAIAAVIKAEKETP